MQAANSSSEVERLRATLDQITRDAEDRVSKLTLKSALPIPEPPRNKLLAGTCPYCNATNSFEMPDRAGETRSIVCQICKCKFLVHLLAGHEILIRPIGRYPRIATGLPDMATQALTNAKLKLSADQVGMLAKLFANKDRELRKNGGIPTPANLLGIILRDTEGLLKLNITKLRVRKFMTLILKGGAFSFQDSAEIGFKNPYVNELQEQGLVQAYVQSSVSVISRTIPLKLESAPQLVVVLLGDHFGGGLELIKEAITNLARTQGLSEHREDIERIDKESDLSDTNRSSRHSGH
jgi:hypothetical protein